jgi:hypothetical protein
MRSLKRKICHAAPCQPSPPFFRPAVQRAPADAPFFQGPVIQRQESKEEEKKDPLTEGFKTTGEKLAEHEPFKKWYEPKVAYLKLSLWDKASPADKAALLTFLGLNLGVAGGAFAADPKIRAGLSDVNIGKPLGWIPYSPIEGFKYKLPEAGKSAYGFSADFTLTSYIELLRKKHPRFPVTGATFGLESEYDPTGRNVSLTGGKFGLEFFGGGLKVEGKTFKDLSPYPQLLHGRHPGDSPLWLMQEVPGQPQIGGPGHQLMINADMLKLFPALTKWL